MTLKSLYSVKEKFRVQRHPTAQEKYVGNYKSDKGLLSRTYKNLKMINSPIPNDLINKSANRIEFVFHH